MSLLKKCTFILLTLLCVHFTRAQTITIIQPNGGEVLYACQQYPVQWTQSGTFSNYWNIDYSLDGGTIWASVATNFLSANGQFTWTVPNIQSSTVLLRVYDAQNPTATDRSNAFFSINFPIAITAPNGGELWQGNTVRNITWNAGGTSNRYNILYSLDNGVNWINIVTNYSTTAGSYAWTVPTLPLNTNCLVRVQDYVQNCMQDISNAVFTISPPTPILITPNGGESLLPYCQTNIAWNTASLYTWVHLEFSANNGASWTDIVDGAPNDGSYRWTVPNIVSTNCLVRVSNSGLPALSDVSNASFSILAPLTLTAPNGGETLSGCGAVTITWQKTFCTGSWYLYYSTDGGANYNYIGAAGDNGAYTQNYGWSIPNGINTNNARFKIVSVNDPTLFDESNGPISIVPSNDITITSPNGGESWQGLTEHNITWTKLPTSSGSYTIQYSTDNGANWGFIASNVTATSYNWTAPNSPSGNCLIKVIDYQNGCKYDVSNTVFSITPATPILITPNGGEVMLPYCQTNIAWNTASLYTSVHLEFSSNNGASWTDIVDGAPNDGSYRWTVPNIVSTNCLVRVSNSGLPALSDVSNATFTILAPLTITAPNGGETLSGCGAVTITWQKTFCTGSWYLYYSTDGGANYNYIGAAGDNGAYTQNYGWDIPNGINTNNAKFKIVSVNDPTLFDESNGPISIVPSNDITITSPNGGESWQGLTSHNITWTKLPTSSGSYTIQYSTDNGANWGFIASNFTATSYNWTVPNSPSGNCLIKVIDYQNGCKYDVSNAVFSITPATPILITPNGGEVMLPYCQTNIAWNTASLYTSVHLEFSSNNGASWTDIVDGAPNDGSYRWTVPNTVSNNCLVRVSNSGLPALSDVSNATFTILAPLTITAPNGGETLSGCGAVTITWQKTFCTGSWYLYYSTDGGANYNYIGAAGDNGAYTQNYGWAIPNGINTNNARFKIVSVNEPTLFDESNGPINIVPSNDITITSPNGGESWQGLTSHNITWTKLPTSSGSYTIQYSTDNGANWGFIASNVTATSYNWTVPNSPSGNCLIKVIDYQNGCKYDISNTVFSITPATPVLIAPNGGEVMLPYCQANIAWNTASLYTSVHLEFSSNNGASWTDIVDGAPNDGSYRWTVPNIVSTNCLVRVSNSGLPALSDVSNATFTILPPLTLTAPNGGETLSGCGVVTITWQKTICTGSWYLYYSTDGGANYNYIGAAGDNGAYTQNYGWDIPNGINTNNAKFKIVSVNDPTLFDESNGPINIVPSNDITITSPNGGESWQGLTSHNITWTKLPTSSGSYTIQYSTDNGANWGFIASNVTATSYNWTVPNSPSGNCLIKVIDYQNGCKYDVSNAVFSITPATPILITPNGGEVMLPYCQTNIAWNTASLYTSVHLEFSSNNGASWTDIVDGAPNDGSYRWTVPNIVSTNCLVRVSNSGLPALSDVSNATFTILPPLTLTAPNGGETLSGCGVVTITWQKTFCTGSWYLYYSTDGGANYNYIGAAGDNGAYTQNYDWGIPNGINVSNAKFKIVSVNEPTLFDESNGPINIVPSNDISITSPNGGESWQGLTEHNITWTKLPTSSGSYTIQYSIDSGANWISIVTNITATSYSWTVPNIPSGNCLIKVIDYQNSCKYDVSNAVFTITPAKPVLIFPNGGEFWYAGMNNNIAWNPASLYTWVHLEYSLDSGLTWVNIVDRAQNTGNFNWTIPNIDSRVALIRISNYNHPSLSDTSDAVFTFKPQ